MNENDDHRCISKVRDDEKRFADGNRLRSSSPAYFTSSLFKCGGPRVPPAPLSDEVTEEVDALQPRTRRRPGARRGSPCAGGPRGRRRRAAASGRRARCTRPLPGVARGCRRLHKRGVLVVQDAQRASRGLRASGSGSALALAERAHRRAEHHLLVLGQAAPRCPPSARKTTPRRRGATCATVTRAPEKLRFRVCF